MSGYEVEYKDLLTRLTSITVKIQTLLLDTDLTQLENQLKICVERKNEEIEVLKREKTEQLSEITDLTNEIGDLKNEILAMKFEKTQQEEEIESLKYEIADFKDLIGEKLVVESTAEVGAAGGGAAGGGELDEHGSLIWTAEATQVQTILDYIGRHVMLNIGSIELRFKYPGGSVNGMKLTKKNFENSINVIVQAFLDHRLRTSVPGPTFTTRMEDSGETWTTYKKTANEYLVSQNLMDALEPPEMINDLGLG